MDMDTQAIAQKMERIRMRSETRKCAGNRIMHVSASVDGTAQWLGKLEKDPLGSNCYFKKKSVMPDNGSSRSLGWNAVFSALGEGDMDAVGLLRDHIRTDKLETMFGLDHGESGWGLMHKAIAFDRVFCLKELLSEGVSASMEDRKGNTAMNIAVWFNSKKCHAILDSESKKLQGTKQRGRLKTGAISAFSVAGDRSKVKRKTKESVDRVERKSKDLGIDLPQPSSLSIASVVTKANAKLTVVPSVSRLADALGRIDGSLGSQVDTSDGWSQSNDSATVDSSFSTASSSTLDNWYSQLPSAKNDRMHRRPGLWGIADQDKHELKRVGQRELWVKKKKKQSRLLRFVKRNLLTSPGHLQSPAKAPPREIRDTGPASPLTDDEGN